MADEKTTKPTIETVLERIGEVKESIVAVEGRMNDRVDALEGRMNERIDKFEERFGVRLDRIESVANKTRAEMLDLRADFRELRTQLKEHLPALE